MNASHEVTPGTVVYPGYDTFMESANTVPYEVTARAFFFKASCLVRL